MHLHLSSRFAGVFWVGLGCIWLAACDAAETTPAQLRFEEMAQAVGVRFEHDHGGRGRYYYVEIMGGGGGLADFDGDGDLDIYAVQGLDLDAPSQERRDGLFRNDGPGEDGLPRFSDVSGELGIPLQGYGLGAAVGDVDGDGWDDIYVTQLGPNALLRNLEGQGFEDVPQAGGAAGNDYSSSAAFVDLDRDGWLDLYVVNYLVYSRETDKVCTDLVGHQEYCGPQSYDPQRDRVYRNLGHGRFEDVTERIGLNRSGPGLGLVAGDFDGNGWIDVYVANDQASNHLWLNQGQDGEFIRFEEEAMFRGSAVDAQGKVEASMGIDAGDLDGDGDEDLFMTHLIGETNTIYLNDGKGFFRDASLQFATGRESLPWTGFGTALTDLDLDGGLDVLVVNGGVRAHLEMRAAGDPLPYREPNLLFLRDAEGGFVERSDLLQEGGATHASRGLATGDLDNDGDLDWVVFNIGGPLQLYCNRSEVPYPWLGFELRDSGGRHAEGARVEVELNDGRRITRHSRRGAGYLSSRDPRVLVGLGNAAGVSEVTVQWVDGGREVWHDLALERYHVLEQGNGQGASPGAGKGSG